MYLLGAFFASGTIRRRQMLFRSSSRDLVAMVKKEMRSEHGISYDTRGKNSFHLVVNTGLPHLVDSLSAYGLCRDGDSVLKRDRAFPSFDPSYAADFIRGFVDAQATCYVQFKHPTLWVKFNRDFLGSLNSMLRMYAGTRRSGPKKNQITYNVEDTKKVREFVYREDDNGDWSYVRDSGLYLPEMRENFMTGRDGVL